MHPRRYLPSCRRSAWALLGGWLWCLAVSPHLWRSPPTFSRTSDLTCTLSRSPSRNQKTSRFGALCWCLHGWSGPLPSKHGFPDWGHCDPRPFSKWRKGRDWHLLPVPHLQDISGPSHQDQNCRQGWWRTSMARFWVDSAARRRQEKPSREHCTKQQRMQSKSWKNNEKVHMRTTALKIPSLRHGQPDPTSKRIPQTHLALTGRRKWEGIPELSRFCDLVTVRTFLRYWSVIKSIRRICFW